jgi:hypothetical protein
VATIAFAFAFLIVFGGAWSLIVGLVAGLAFGPVLFGAFMLTVGFGCLRSMQRSSGSH